MCDNARCSSFTKSLCLSCSLFDSATIQRFWAKVEIQDDCWLWTGSQRNKGYGAFVYKRDSSHV